MRLFAFSLRKENAADQKAGKGSKLMHNSPYTKIKGNKRFLVFGIKNSAKAAVAS